jgi:hypothetical protein
MAFPRPRTVLLGRLLVVGLGVLVERLVVTDREAIEQVLKEGLEAARARDFARMRPLLSDSFSWNRLGPDEAVESLQRLMGDHPARISATWGPIEPEGDRCVVDVSVTVMPYAGLFPVRVTFVRENGDWRVREVRSA